MDQDRLESDTEDEEGRDSFPASDPPGEWAGPDVAPESSDRPAEGGTDPIPDPLPEAESPRVAAAWEDSDAMEGQAPTG
jgi:hypothetical protein